MNFLLRKCIQLILYQLSHQEFLFIQKKLSYSLRSRLIFNKMHSNCCLSFVSLIVVLLLLFLSFVNLQDILVLTDIQNNKDISIIYWWIFFNLLNCTWPTFPMYYSINQTSYKDIKILVIFQISRTCKQIQKWTIDTVFKGKNSIWVSGWPAIWLFVDYTEKTILNIKKSLNKLKMIIAVNSIIYLLIFHIYQQKGRIFQEINSLIFFHHISTVYNNQKLII